MGFSGKGAREVIALSARLTDKAICSTLAVVIKLLKWSVKLSSQRGKFDEHMELQQTSRKGVGGKFITNGPLVLRN